MKKIILKRPSKILNLKKKIEENLDIKIFNRGRELYFSGSPEREYIAEKVIDALNFGFLFDSAISIKKEENLFEIINIKDYTSKKNLKIIRARLIGKNGKTKQVLNRLTQCYFEIRDNEVGIIGPAEFIKNAQEAIIHLIKGAKHSNVYANLEKNQPKQVLDLGLKR
jgi:ribosomal RNA assembly protein